MTIKQKKLDPIRDQAEEDLESFIRLVHPGRVLGSMHTDLLRWWYRPTAKSHQLVLLPRDHQKSAMMAYRVAFEITRNPAIRILYISSTANLAVKQLKFIKDILTSKIYQKHWPEMIAEKVGDREKWTETEISVDHPIRKQESVRDPTVFTAGLTTNIVGLHCDIACIDDAVVDETADTEEGRTRLRNQVSYLASIAGAESSIWVVGTRYNPRDLYHDMREMTWYSYDDFGNEIESHQLYEIYEKKVEDAGDGSGEFIWPRMQRADGKWFGFNRDILSKKKAQYADLSKFRAQYYNDPNDSSQASIKRELFKYYKPERLKQVKGRWYYSNEAINVVAAVDFAYSTKKKADFSCIAVVGMDRENNYYVLDIDRFKTDKISDYYDRIFKLYVKWGFRKLRAEISLAQSVIVEDLKDNYIRKNNIPLTIDGHRPTRWLGGKEERLDAIFQPKYQNGQIYHYVGGNCNLLEEELILQRPPHDDVKDAVASAIEFVTPPTSVSQQNQSARYADQVWNKKNSSSDSLEFHSRFGGLG